MRFATFNPDGSIETAHNDNTIDQLPDGAIELTDEQFRDWPNYRRNGQMVVYAPPAQISNFATQKAAETARWMAIREPYFGRLASIASRLYTSDPAGSASADAVSNSLLGLFTDSTVTAATDISTYRAALKARYGQAVSLATPSAAAEFGKYDK